MRTTMIRSRYNCMWVSVLVAFFLVLGLTECKCIPSSCGDIHNISYPFRLKSDDPKHCSLKSPFTLECDHNNVTLLRLFSHDYHVKAIDYYEEETTSFDSYGSKTVHYESKASIRVVDPGLDKNDCSSLPRFPLSRSNFSSWEQEDNTWQPSSNHYSVIFLRCANPVVNSSQYVTTAPCISQSENMYGYVVISGRPRPFRGIFPEDLENGCTVYSMALVDDHYSVDPRDVTYEELHNQMAEGFGLWYYDYDYDYDPFVNNPCLHAHWLFNYECYPRSIRGRPLTLGFGQLIVAGFTIHTFGIDWSVMGFGIFIVLIVLVARFVSGVVFVSALVIRKWRRRHWSAYHTIEDFLNTDSFVPIRYTYFNIKKMSNGFKDKLGAGGFGSVFKCKLRSGRFGAIKLLSKSQSNGEVDFTSEIATIGRIHHVNVVQLIGYCVEGSKRALVYDFMPNGSLDKYIFSNKESLITLSYTKMYEIAVGVAQGIEYLHQGCEMQILHFDIKPHNILLDENFVPKISDFGLAKLYPANNSIVSTMAARGTMGYIAPELFYKNIGAVSYKADVYSFGMLLMEMASRRKNLNAFADHSSQLYFPSWVYDQYNDGKDMEIGDDATDEEKMITRKMVVVALWCIQMRPTDRPSMKRVLQMLVGDVESLELPPKPSFCPQPTPGGNLQVPPACSSTVELTYTLSAR